MNYQSPLNDTTATAPKMFPPHELLLFIDIVKYGLEALDIYTINIPGIPGGQIAKPSGQLPRSKEEKEVLEHFSGIVR